MREVGENTSRRNIRTGCRLTTAHALAPALKLLKRLLHDRKGDANLQGFGVTDRWTFKSRNALGKAVTELTRAGADPDLCHAKAQNDLPVLALDI